MACFGSKALQSRGPNTQSNLADDTQMDVTKKKNKNRRPAKEHHRSDGGNQRGRFSDKSGQSRNSSKQFLTDSQPQTSTIRKQVDPETTEYFMRITNLFEGNEIDLEERSVLCGNALEETRGKELELATDYILSHTMQTLLDGCSVDHLCGFLKSCGDSLTLIAVDRSGSHVIETALRSLAIHLQDNEAYSTIEETLTNICEVVVVNPLPVMCSPYGSHVLRSLLCICKGIPLDSMEGFHVTKSVLADRVNTQVAQSVGDNQPQQGFPDLLKFVVKEMLKHGRQDIATLQVDQYSSLVLQTALKLLAGEDEDLMFIIPMILGCNKETSSEGNSIEITAVKVIVKLLKDNAFSHLMEVILEVAPETLYNEMFLRIFRNSLFKISSDHCGSFVVQALVSSAKCQGQMDLIWEELGGKFKELLEYGKSGVVASILAASQRLCSHDQKCCEALAAAVCSMTEFPTCIVPRLLFLDSYIYCEDKSSWEWAKGGKKMHVLGCLMLQTVFKYPSEFIQSYIKSIISMEAAHVFETAKDPGGRRVIESLLDSGVSAKQKRKLISKLREHFGELSMHPSGSFTVGKCFTVANASLKEVVASELLAVRGELSKTRHGPLLLRKLDIDGFAERPEQWRSRQESKQNIYNEFYATFGSKEAKSSKDSSFGDESSKYKRSRDKTSCPSPPHSVKKLKKEIDQYLGSSSTPSGFPGLEASMAKLGIPGLKRPRESAEQVSKKFVKDDTRKRKKK